MHRGCPHPLLLCVLLSACTGTLSERMPGAAANDMPGVDAGTSPAPTCDDPVTVTDSGHHNAGQACMQCHAAGGSGPQFTLGGTLYDGSSSSTAVDGASIHLLDATGTEVVLKTALNGNFYTTQALTFPLTVSSSSCPNTQKMVSSVAQSGADCNSSGCHASNFRIHLP